MQFGSVKNPDLVDFSLPADNYETEDILAKGKNELRIYVGCAKWNKSDLKGFYPRGTKDELEYYAKQFNSIELNATFYNNYSPEQIAVWRDKTPDDFRFFPKVWNYVSHVKRLNGFQDSLKEFLRGISSFEDKLGATFLQLHDNFKPSNLDRLSNFIEYWPKEIPLAVELRNAEWFEDRDIAKEVNALFEENKVTNIITDTAGRRDLLHMRLTTTSAFIRYVGANHPSDYMRLDDWIDRIELWKNQGLENLYFFIHQNIEKESPLLSAYFIDKLNERINTSVRGPKEIKGLF